MEKELLYTTSAFAFFIICPRMAGMAHVISKYSEFSLFTIALVGSVIAIPLVLLMVWIFSKFGITGAMVFCILTDLSSAFLLKGISIKASIDTIIIAVFLIIAVKIAPLISGTIIK